MLRAHCISHQCLRSLEHLLGRLPVVQSAGGQYVGEEHLGTQYAVDSVIDPFALLMTGWGEVGIAARVVLGQRLQHRALILIHVA
jgi:hypothetical protein